ncbi:hypothetical protein DsansV1_C04g0049441 [Dioscorea sansibarensis]
MHYSICDLNPNREGRQRFRLSSSLARTTGWRIIKHPSPNPSWCDGGRHDERNGSRGKKWSAMIASLRTSTFV